ncbi:MAG: HAD family hydrolase, partial [Firmicutes bacterium]|nr:HAD family hydrolase [Bacillota bacterium]
TEKMKNVAVFFDRDGTIIEDVGYINDPDLIKFCPGTAKALKKLKERGLQIAIISNQSGVARGYFDEATVNNIHENIRKKLRRQGVSFDHIDYCPHLPDALVGYYGNLQECRKPRTGMLKKAEKKLKVDLKKSYIVGDKASDLETGGRAGCKSILILTGEGRATFQALESLTYPCEYVAGTLEEAADWILKDIEKK